MAKFIFEMPADLAEAVETHRIRTGAKATAEAVRDLLWGGLRACDERSVSAPTNHAGRQVAQRKANEVARALVGAVQLGPAPSAPGSRLKKR